MFNLKPVRTTSGKEQIAKIIKWTGLTVCEEKNKKLSKDVFMQARSSVQIVFFSDKIFFRLSRCSMQAKPHEPSLFVFHAVCY